MNDKIKHHLCFKYVCNWITLLIFKHTLLITSHGSCVFKAFYRKFNNRYMFLRKFHKIEMKADLDADEIWRSVWLGLFLRWVKIFTIQIKIFIHQAYLNSKALIGSFRHDGCPSSKARLRTHPRRCTSCWPNTCHTLSIQITSTSLFL